MKKYLLSFAVLAMGMSLLTACSDDDDEPQKQAVDVSNGLFIVGSGNKTAGIDGNVSYIDYTKGTREDVPAAAAQEDAGGRQRRSVGSLMLRIGFHF